MKPDYLFVYGTLRKQYGLQLLEEIAEHLAFVGEASVNAVLYDLGDYPAAFPGTANEKIRGDVYAVSRAEAVFPLLDAYEGDEYRRQSVQVKLPDRQTLEAWIYWYKGVVDKSQRIRENDYLTYLENKKDRFL